MRELYPNDSTRKTGCIVDASPDRILRFGSRKATIFKNPKLPLVGFFVDALDDQQDSPPPERWNVWVLDLVEMTCEITLADVDLEEAADFKSVWTDTKSQVVILPTDFEIANREEQAGKLGAIASQLLDLSFGTVDDAKASSRIHEAFHKAVVAGQ